jgi:hypothetical protein
MLSTNDTILPADYNISSADNTMLSAYDTMLSVDITMLSIDNTPRTLCFQIWHYVTNWLNRVIS